MSRHRYNNVQMRSVTSGLLQHQKQQQLDMGQPENEQQQRLPVWPSERIGPGGSGAFHTAKVEYSKETAELLKLLMKESKMSMLMRKQINESLAKGEPLPLPKPPRPNTSNDPDKETLAILDRARKAKRKNLRQIEASGAYNSTYYRPRADNRQSTEKAKAQLQHTMAGIDLPDPAIKPLRRSREDLLDQIQERAEWLAEMESLGHGQKYQAEIRDQISERLHRIRALETKIKMKAAGGYRFVD
ncbi:CG5280 [Drosophila busckii]|uniref:CG5280 n=1 Tax=Drosophila busckii TaxID=30019 RepID=A0A0M5J3L5_DROBS|nr:CG5280 [Drosophila busckii]